MIATSPHDQLAAALQSLQREDVAALPEGALGEDLVALSRTLDLLRAEMARRVGVFHGRRECGAEGFANTVQWLRWRCRMTPGAAANLVALGRQLESLPQVGAALRGGEIGYDHAASIGRTAEWVGEEAMARVEGDFVEAARRLDPFRLGVAGRWFRAHAAPERFGAEAVQAHELRRGTFSRTGDFYYLDGRLDLEGGAALERALDALMPPRELTRPAPQRRADARLPRAGGHRPHLVVVADARLERGELEGVGPIPRSSLERIACDATLTRFWVGEDGKLNAGRTRRTWNSATWKAMEARDRHCRFEGCDRPAAWCEGHHVQPVGEGGHTRADQGVLLCRYHHRFVHDRRLRARFEGDRVVFDPP